MPTLDLPDTAALDDPGHISDHNKIVTAIAAVNAALGEGAGTYVTDLGAVTGGSPVTVTHNLGTYDVVVQIVEKDSAGAGAAAGALVDATVDLTSTNALTVTFTSSAAANLYRVIVLASGGSSSFGVPLLVLDNGASVPGDTPTGTVILRRPA